MVTTPAHLRRSGPFSGAGGYEEYHPYGTTAWQAPELTTVSVKRYKYTGMERDEETGLQRHGVRYYATWLGRWVSADPIGLGGEGNGYAYCSLSPVLLSDSGGRKPVKPQTAAPTTPQSPAAVPQAAAAAPAPAPPPYTMAPLPAAPPLPANVTVSVIAHRAMEELTPHEIKSEISSGGDVDRLQLLKSADAVLDSGERTTFASTAALRVTASSIPIGGNKYQLSFTITADPNSVLAYEDAGSFGAENPDEDMRKGTTQEMSQGQFGTNSTTTRAEPRR